MVAGLHSLLSVLILSAKDELEVESWSEYVRLNDGGGAEKEDKVSSNEGVGSHDDDDEVEVG